MASMFEMHEAQFDSEMSNLRKVIEEVKTLREELENTSRVQQETQNDLQEIGANVEEFVAQAQPASQTATETRATRDLIREVLRNSRFEWTTIGTMTKRTALDRDQILGEVRSMNDIRIGTGKRSHDIIFRFKREGET